MTPKEKAKELVDRFYNNAESRNKIGAYDEDLHRNNSKQCALIAVDEIIKANPYEVSKTDMDSTIDYWEEVKKEIEAL